MTVAARPLPATPGDHLPWSVLLPFSAPNLVLGAMELAVFVYLPPYFAGHLGVGTALIGGVWWGVRMIDILVDLLLAVLMDRTRTAIGRYRLWLPAGAPLLMLGLYKLFMAPSHFGAGYLLTWLLVMYFGYSMVYLAHSAWGARLATRYHERSRLFGTMTAVGVVGALGILAISIMARRIGLTDVGSVPAMGWAMIVALPLTIALATLRTREKITPEADGPRFAWADVRSLLKNPDLRRLFFSQFCLTLGPGWMAAMYLFYFKAARGFTTAEASILLGFYALSQFPGAIAATQLSRRIGKHRTLVVASAGFSLGLLSILFIPKADLPATAPALAWGGVTAGAFTLMIRAMLADVGDAVRLEQGRERIGLLYSTNILAQKIASAFSIGLTYVLLAAIGFNPAEHAVNTAAAIGKLQVTFIGGPILFVLLGGACMIGWRLDARRHDQIRAQLEARDARLEGAA
jgi:GPH family glycoside/pentoside/hexuronide:cation symporter